MAIVKIEWLSRPNRYFAPSLAQMGDKQIDEIANQIAKIVSTFCIQGGKSDPKLIAIKALTISKHF